MTIIDSGTDASIFGRAFKQINREVDSSQFVSILGLFPPFCSVDKSTFARDIAYYLPPHIICLLECLFCFDNVSVFLIHIE